MRALSRNFRYSAHWSCLEVFPGSYFVVALLRQILAIRISDVVRIEEAPETGWKSGTEVSRAV